jgi:hypothetical protein
LCALHFHALSYPLTNQAHSPLPPTYNNITSFLLLNDLLYFKDLLARAIFFCSQTCGDLQDLQEHSLPKGHQDILRDLQQHTQRTFPSGFHTSSVPVRILSSRFKQDSVRHDNRSIAQDI